MKLSDEARAARNEYMRQYRANMTEEEREHVREYRREWRKANPEKIEMYNARYWENKAREMNGK